jgi:tetratricopeptide (TPR) repeat protein
MKTSNWSDFPQENSGFDYSTGQLKDVWSRLHAGDREPFPDAGRLEGVDGDPAETASTLIDAWRAFHRGDFAKAVELADGLGLIGHAVANKACGIYADYLEEDDGVKQAIYKEGIERAEQAIEAFPDDANAHYFHAFLLGRYSQCLSVAKALAQGLGGKIRKSLERALELAPDHAEAHTAMGLYHAEIIDKVGKMVGSMTYGASATKAMECFERALELTPEAPIAQMEYGNALYMLYGDKRLSESNEAYRRAAELEPRDAMEFLDSEYARASMEE